VGLTTTTVPSRAATLRPVVTGRTRAATVSDGAVLLRLHCAGAACSGTVRLWDGHVLLGKAPFNIAAGRTVGVVLHLGAKALTAIDKAAHGLSATETVLVHGGQRWTARVRLMG
jgi:hypothetical protein